MHIVLFVGSVCGDFCWQINYLKFEGVEGVTTSDSNRRIMVSSIVNNFGMKRHPVESEIDPIFLI